MSNETGRLITHQSSLITRSRRVHLVGVGGSGMSSLAELLLDRGLEVSGSDVTVGAPTSLTERGARVAVGHRAEQVDGADLVIVSAAIPPDNPELIEAHRRGLPILTHAEALGELMRGLVGVAVAGTHGKSTTSALLGFILASAGLDPTVLVGARAVDFGGGARSGQGPHLVVEADEYDRRFLTLNPALALITSIEADHLDCFGDLDEIVGAFRAFVNRLPPAGLLVTCADDPVLASLDLPRRRLTYGVAERADWRLDRLEPRHGGGCSFRVRGPAGEAHAQLQLSGLHNASNAAGALAATTALGVDLGAAVQALAAFRGTERRFQTLTRAGEIWVVDDYAHHPTAVRATLEAARQVHPGRLWAVFQPHTSNRVAALMDSFATAFVPADLLTLLPIYQPPGRGRGERPVSSIDLAAAIERPDVRLADSLAAAEAELAAALRPGDLALVMGAGDVTRLAQGLARRIEERAG